MKWFTRFGSPVLLLTVCFLSACATQPLSTLSVEQQVLLLQKANKFGAAERILDNATAETLEPGKISALKEHNEIASAQFERNAIAAAGEMQENLQWGAASAYLGDATNAYPEGKELADAAEKLQLARDDFLGKKQLEHSVLRAKRIPIELENLSALDDASSDPQWALEHQRLQSEASAIAEYLLQEGQASIDREQWKQADQLLRLSFALRNDQRTSTALRETKANYAPSKRRSKTKKASKEKTVVALETVEISTASLASAAMQRFKLLVQQNELVAARAEINRASRLQANDPQIKKETLRLDGLISSAVQQRVEQGKYEYSLGNIDQAVGHWEYAFALTPEDESLKERLEKARLFKQRYEQLKR